MIFEIVTFVSLFLRFIELTTTVLVRCILVEKVVSYDSMTIKTKANCAKIFQFNIIYFLEENTGNQVPYCRCDWTRTSHLEKNLTL
jgi:hypothetical protein